MQCPICKREFSQNEKPHDSFLPFCSERCKLIDLGRWLGGKYQIPVSRELDEEDPLPPPPERSPDDD